MIECFKDDEEPDIWYKQCWLKRDNIETTSWIPEKFAIVGNYIKLKDKDVWTDGWLVMSSVHRITSKRAIAQSRLHLKQREASDI